MTYEQIVSSFEKRAISRGGLMLYDCDTAISLVRRVSEAGFAILGIDGFFLGEQETRPSLEDSIDLSAATLPREMQTERAIKFLMERRGHGLHFEVVVDDEPSRCGKQ